MSTPACFQGDVSCPVRAHTGGVFSPPRRQPLTQIPGSVVRVVLWFHRHTWFSSAWSHGLMSLTNRGSGIFSSVHSLLTNCDSCRQRRTSRGGISVWAVVPRVLDNLPWPLQVVLFCSAVFSGIKVFDWFQGNCSSISLLLTFKEFIFASFVE